MTSCRIICPHCKSQVKPVDGHPHNGYYFVKCHCDVTTYYQAYYHWESKELISECISFPEFLLSNNVMDYPKESLLLPRTLRTAGVQISGWRWVEEAQFSYWSPDPILTLEEPLALDLDQLEPLKDLIRSLIVFS